MSLFRLVIENVWMKKARSLLTAFAIAIAVMTVVSLGIVTQSLKTTAAAILATGQADFTVAQKNASDILYSSVTTAQVARVARTAGVASAVGVLLETEKLNAKNPLFIEIGITPQDLSPFGIRILAGRAFSATASNQMILGWRLAQDLGIKPGDKLNVAGGPKVVTGLFSTGNVFGDSAGMFPLVPLQAFERQPSGLSLIFVKVTPGTNINRVATRVGSDNPGLTTVRTASQFGRADTNYRLITAADTGATIIAVIIGAVIVMNTMLLSLFERTREFGVMRSVGWRRVRLVELIMGEASVTSLLGAAIGVGLAYTLTRVLARLPSLEGILQPHYSPNSFVRALITALAVACLGALYPAIRAAFLTPLEALRRE
ncbi:MAG: ABC transporter permease [Acidimicrobiia bacterium]